MLGKLVFQEFEAVAPRVASEKAARARDGVVIGNFNAAGQEGLAQLVQLGDSEGGMSFSGGTEIGLDADVELLRATIEPAAASGTERIGLFNLGHAEEEAVKFASGGFAAWGSGDLDVIEVFNSKEHCR